ncbi:hypothetical protein N802_06910 [Knoellia sinensis KCTC 19936]|uniref:Restriction endonuclease type II EcoRII C-terminal domain-containing protein n=1 Tax=Knoellia sinensis KCTC 19936 TaxID=1385520 RepID=A0A0A0J4L6_9MICO|nr:type II restriction endonuclease [Knoellia sinensis]KGN30541.1 hypothetical protein N802_06910 [Knoellia sinensis KCTC 19936]
MAAKRLSAVEADRLVSNQHEFNGVQALKDLLGTSERRFPTRYVYLHDDEDGPSIVEFVSTSLWYDARAAHPTRSEFRLYFPENEPMGLASESDFCFLALGHDGLLTIVIAPEDSQAAQRLDILFQTHLTSSKPQAFRVVTMGSARDRGIDMIDVTLIEALGGTPEPENPSALARLIEQFGGNYPLPSTMAFTGFTRELCIDADPVSEPDATLSLWFSTTNDLFLTYERHVLQPILDQEFANLSHIDVDRFFSVATRFKNSRFSRSGASFEHHLAALFTANQVSFHQPRHKYPDGAKPDFIVPSDDAYRAMNSSVALVAAKTSVKERWRQIATEARHVPTRYLATMDPAISVSAADDMAKNNLQLVLPKPLNVRLATLSYAELINRLKVL